MTGNHHSKQQESAVLSWPVTRHPNRMDTYIQRIVAISKWLCNAYRQITDARI